MMKMEVEVNENVCQLIMDMIYSQEKYSNKDKYYARQGYTNT